MTRRSNNGSFDGVEDMDRLGDAGQENVIRIPPAEENRAFHITSVMLHLLQMKWSFGGEAHEDENLHLKNFIDVCAPFDIACLY